MMEWSEQAATTIKNVATIAGIVTGLLAAGAAAFAWRADAVLSKYTDKRFEQLRSTTAQAEATAARAIRDTAIQRARTAELDRQTAGLTAQAAQARLETEQLRARIAWRQFSPQNRRSAVEKLLQFAGQKFGLSYRNDPESEALLNQMRGILSDARWIKQKPLDSNFPMNAEGDASHIAGTGIEVIWPPASPVLEHVAESLSDAFRMGGIQSTTRSHPQLNQRPDTIELVIGSKSAPN
jgi:hypothetical protein